MSHSFRSNASQVAHSRRLVRKAAPALLLAVLVSLAAALTAFASPGDTSLVSVDNAGNQGNGSSGGPALSADGRYVAFASSADNLVPGDTNGQSDVFVRDRQTGTTERVSVDSAGNETDGFNGQPSISADGRYVAFESFASNMVSGDVNGALDVFVRDRQAGTTERVSVDNAGNEGDNHSFTSQVPAFISADGRFVTFWSDADNLVSGDTNGQSDAFVHDRQTGTTERVSVDGAGNEGDSSSVDPVISPDGRYVGFGSLASNLTPEGNNNGSGHVFIHDRQTGATDLLDQSSDGTPGNFCGGVGTGCDVGAFSADNRYVAFWSRASNLVPGDTNDEDAFVRDRQTGTTERVSVDSAGNQPAGFGHLQYVSMSADGRYVAFKAQVPHLVPDDTAPGTWDVFVHDRQTGATQRVDVDSAGNPPDSSADNPALSADGHYVAFGSGATNLVSGDANGQADVFLHELGETPPPIDSVDGHAVAGGTVSTNSATSSADPLGTSITTPTGGNVTIDEGATTMPDPTGFTLLGQEVQITAPTETVESPLVIQFRIDASLLPPGANQTNVQVFRDGTVMPDCDAGAGTSATPDPCVAGRAATANGIALTVRTSQASTWNFGVSSVDTTPPETTITSGPAVTNDSTPTFGFASNEASSTFRCSIDLAAFGPCSGPGATHTPAHALADGLHVFRVRATDPAGNTDRSPANRLFIVDTHAPNTTISSGPSGPTSDSTPTFRFSSSEPGSHFQCRTDSAAFTPCSGPGASHTTAALSDGAHTFQVRAIDAAGNTDQTPAGRTFTVDTHAPDTTITSGPSGSTRDRNQSFRFVSSEPSGARFQCSLDGAAFSACSSPKTLSNLSFGSHTFRVRAIDAAGNVDPTPATRTFTVTH